MESFTCHNISVLFLVRLLFTLILKRKNIKTWLCKLLIQFSFEYWTDRSDKASTELYFKSNKVASLEHSKVFILYFKLALIAHWNKNINLWLQQKGALHLYYVVQKQQLRKWEININFSFNLEYQRFNNLKLALLKTIL